MSWVFGFSGRIEEQGILRFSSLFPEPKFTFRNSDLFITAGGNEFTCLFSPDKNWIVLGSGIETDDSSSVLMDKDAWEKRIQSGSFDEFEGEPEGHYLIIKWENENIKFYCDPIGLRTIYFYKDKSGIYFSSNLDWITLLIDKVKIDFNEFGSRWLTFNQLSNNSFISDVKRLPPASRAEINRGKINIDSNDWFPSIQPSNEETLFYALRKFLEIKLPEKLKLSLGLSGGLDSRFLLSILHQTSKEYCLHSYGYQDDADLMVTKIISRRTPLNIEFLKPEDINSSKLFPGIKNYVSAAHLVGPVSSYLRLSVFDDTYFYNKFLVDGAFGEFARRQYLNRLLLKGRKAIQRKNYSEIVGYLMVNRPPIFKKEYAGVMMEGIVNQLKKIFEIFPEPGEIGFENFMDLIAAKFRLPNYFGPEQARLDCMLPGIMPFAQREIISNALGMPVDIRRNGKFFYSIIKKNFLVLTKFPLVKNSITYPFGMSTITSYVYTSLKKSISRSPSDIAQSFYNLFEKEIRSIINRDSIREYGCYDERAVISIVDNFYNGSNQNWKDIDWLLTFELFRKSLNINSV